MAWPDTAAVEALFGPCRIGPVVTGNRFVRAGTSEGMVDHGNFANADLARLLGQLAGLGVGLIITGHMFVDRRGQYDDDQTAIDTDKAIGPLAAVAAAVHRHGGKIFAQLSHAGSQSADAERVIFAYIDLDRVAEAGQRSPLVTPRKDRRRDLYSVTYLGHQL